MNKVALCVVFMIFIMLLAGCDSGSSDPQPNDIFCVFSVNGGEYTYGETVFIKAGDSLDFRPVYICDRKYFSSVSGFYMDGNRIITEPSAGLICKWYLISPVLKKGGYDNFTAAPRNDFKAYIEPISYHAKRIRPSGEGISFSDFARPGLSGTYYMNATLPDTELTDFINKERIQGKEGIIQVVCRRDDSYLGYLCELMGTPFIMYPKVLPPGMNQTDVRIGSDCAEFAIYGRRRMGFDIPYCGPKKIYEYLIPVVNGRFYLQAVEKECLLLDKNGNTLSVGEAGVRPGDILHYGSQVAVFYEDRGVLGVLDGEDLVLQSYGESPHYAMLSNNAQVFGAFEVYRWK